MCFLSYQLIILVITVALCRRNLVFRFTVVNQLFEILFLSFPHDINLMYMIFLRAEYLSVLQFLATVSHEIRTPMNGVLGNFEIINKNS